MERHWLASGSVDKAIIIWDLESGAEIKKLKGHSDFVNSILFSPNGNTLASASNDKTIKI